LALRALRNDDGLGGGAVADNATMALVRCLAWFRHLTVALLLAAAQAIAAPTGETAAVAGDGLLERALAAYQAGEIDPAQQLFLQAARRGDVLAAYNAAVIRLNGESAEPAEQEAVDLLMHSARAGFGMAQHMLATLYERGQFLPSSQPLAVHWYRLAAEQGDAAAQLSLATQYYLGRGTERDYREAARWYGNAAEAGDAGAQYIVASMYEKGLGVEADLDQALVWYSAAARQGDVAAHLKAKEVVERLAAERGQ
jgi:TPR repeat protein